MNSPWHTRLVSKAQYHKPCPATFKPHEWRYASDAPGRQYGDRCVRCETCGLKAIAPLTPVRPAP
jgi:hypothetical protein